MKKQPLPERLEGEAVLLLRHTLDESARMFALVEEDRARLREFLPWVDATLSLADETAFLQRSIEQWSACESFHYSLFRKGDSVYVGNVGVHTIDWGNERCELGYWIARNFEGRGFVSQAVGLLERACFAVGFNRVEMRCSSSNDRSARIPRRNGYHLDGILREDALENGRFRDTLVFSKLKRDTLE